MAKSSGNGVHVVAVRMRVLGAGNLKLILSDLSDVQTLPLVDLPMSASTRIEPTRLANFESQRIRLEGKTTEIDETFQISKVILFAKVVSVEYPSN